MNEEFKYVTGQARPSFPKLFEKFDEANLKAVSTRPWVLDYPYGEHARETMDFCLASVPAKANLIYIHAGYWQSRDKSQFRFIAPALSNAGYNVAIVNYPLSPEATIEQIIRALAKAPAAAINYFSTSDQTLPLIISGHSAGGHLSTELALRLPELSEPNSPISVSAVVAISGIFDLLPLLRTTLNVKLNLNSESAFKASPVARVVSNKPPAIFAVGVEETDEFKRQSRDMAKAWINCGNYAEYHEIPGDHFSLLEGLRADDSLLFDLFQRALVLCE